MQHSSYNVQKQVLIPPVDRIIDHLKLRFVAEKPPPCHVFQQVALLAAEERADYF